MITFNDIKAYHSKLSGAQQALVCALAIYEKTNNSVETICINDCIERAQCFLKNGNVNAELQNDKNYSDDDLKSVLNLGI